jgi:23S rRNA (pseudouridine1915-N3)-methyltransferase
MRIHLLTVSKKPPEWVRTGFEEYAQRLPGQLSLNAIAVAPVARGHGQSPESAKRKEAGRIAAVIPRGSRVVALDEKGTQFSSAELAAQLGRWLGNSRDVVMVVGGADGLDAAFVQSADEVWSLSKLTLPHALVPIVVAEQLYRAWSLLCKHPYHRS